MESPIVLFALAVLLWPDSPPWARKACSVGCMIVFTAVIVKRQFLS